MAPNEWFFLPRGTHIRSPCRFPIYSKVEQPGLVNERVRADRHARTHHVGRVFHELEKAAGDALLLLACPIWFFFYGCCFGRECGSQQLSCSGASSWKPKFPLSRFQLGKHTPPLHVHDNKVIFSHTFRLFVDSSVNGYFIGAEKKDFSSSIAFVILYSRFLVVFWD